MVDNPANPASSASVSMARIAASSDRVGFDRASVAFSMPIAATRMSECPIKAATFAPSGNERRCSTYERASRQVRLCLTTRMDRLPRQRLDAGEHVRAVVGIGEHRRQRAVTHQNRRDAVAHRLRESWSSEHLDVVVRVDVNQARHHPLALGIHDLRAVRGQRLRTDRRNLPGADAEIPDRRRSSQPVEIPPAANHHVVRRHRTPRFTARHFDTS